MSELRALYPIPLRSNNVEGTCSALVISIIRKCLDSEADNLLNFMAFTKSEKAYGVQRHGVRS